MRVQPYNLVNRIVDMQAIQTRYKGYHFRSRLEARWAVFFDVLGVPYEYEKEGFNLDGSLYLPDFWLPTLGMWLEIKGAEPTKEELRLVELLAQGEAPAGIAHGLPCHNPVTIYCADVTDGSGGFGAWEECTWCFDTRDGLYKFNSHNRWSSREYLTEGWQLFPGLIGLQHDPEEPEKIRQAAGVAMSARFEHGETPQI